MRYSIGMFPKDVQVNSVKKGNAAPGLAKRINDRNPQPTEDVPVKVITQGRFDPDVYNPTSYFKP